MAQPDWMQKQLLVVLQKAARDRRTLHEILSILMTGREYDELARRLEILRALDAGIESQRTIATRLGTSIATVTRGSNEYHRNREKLLKYLVKI